MHVLRHDKGFQCLNTYTSTKVFNQEADCLCHNTPVPVILIDAIPDRHLTDSLFIVEYLSKTDQPGSVLTEDKSRQ